MGAHTVELVESEPPSVRIPSRNIGGLPASRVVLKEFVEKSLKGHKSARSMLAAAPRFIRAYARIAPPEFAGSGGPG